MLLAEVLDPAPTTTTDALALFDAAPAVTPESMAGTWRGAELPTGHPLDGLLAATGWWGKEFVDSETVHPLLFTTQSGSELWAAKPHLAFSLVGLFTRFPSLKKRDFRGTVNALSPVLRTPDPQARLRTTRYRGVDTATMVYDRLPIQDVFRRLDDDSVIGAMDLRGSAAPYFFVLRRSSDRLEP